MLTGPQSAEACPSSKYRASLPPGEAHPDSTSTTLASLEKLRQRREREETQEQVVALARGGVRHVGKVFHRKGVKLTADSPRSMLPRDVSLIVENACVLIFPEF